jgi:hypothetical protein
MTTTIDVLQQAAERGLRLKAVGNDLHVNPARSCSADFAETLRDYKPRLLTLLQLPFAMAYSQILGETIFFCEDEDTKAALMEAGADPWSIYKKDELRVLEAHNRARPFIPNELLKLHEIRKTLHGRITK